MINAMEATKKGSSIKRAAEEYHYMKLLVLLSYTIGLHMFSMLVKLQ